MYKKYMSSQQIDSYGISKTYLNGNLIDDTAYDASYDGTKLDLALAKNTGEKYVTQLNNNDLNKLFNSMPVKSGNIENRLIADFKLKKFKTRSKKRRKSHKKHRKSYKKSHKKSHKKSYKKSLKFIN